MNNPINVTKVKESCHFYMVHRRDAKRAERKFLYKNLCGLCVSAVSYRFRHFLLQLTLGTFNPGFVVLTNSNNKTHKGREERGIRPAFK
jgi:hypothetical protein